MLTLLVIRTHSLHQGVLCPAWYLLCILADVTIYPPSQNPWRGFPVQICFIQRYLPFSQPLASFIIFFYLFQSIGFFFFLYPAIQLWFLYVFCFSSTFFSNVPLYRYTSVHLPSLSLEDILPFHRVAFEGSFCNMHVQGDGSVSQEIALQVWGPELISQNLWISSAVINLRIDEVEMARSLGLTS